ncbi:MAG: 50S ribosomal protein L11 methyltransferase [bacterium]
MVRSGGTPDTGAGQGSDPAGWTQALIQFVNPSEETLSTFVSECYDRGALGSAEGEGLDGLDGAAALPEPECEACGRFALLSVYFPGTFEMEAIIELIESVRRDLQAAFPDFTARLLGCQRVRKEEWATDWKKTFAPMRVADRIWVAPPWQIPDLPRSSICIVMEPGLAFGTGRHATTRLCLHFLDEILTKGGSGPRRPRSLLDVGCGSGILSMAGRALGVARVVGLDKDLEAVQVARKNLALNNGGAPIHLIAGGLACVRSRFDLIAANIDTRTLTESLAPLLAVLEEDGFLILSGFLRADRDHVRSAYEQAGLRPASEKIDPDEGWTALLYRAPQPEKVHG